MTGHIESTTIVFVEAMKEMFAGTNHPDPEMRNLSVHTEYPVDRLQYPGFWVQYTPQGDVQNAGIGHYEWGDGEEPGTLRKVYRWRFSGVVEIVVAALSNLERARLIDALIRTIAVGVVGDGSVESTFRAYIQSNDLIGLAVAWESFNVGGFAENPGTPWETEEVIYEGTVTLTLEGEFGFDPIGADLVPLSKIKIDEPILPGYPDIDPTGTQGAWR